MQVLYIIRAEDGSKPDVKCMIVAVSLLSPIHFLALGTSNRHLKALANSVVVDAKRSRVFG